MARRACRKDSNHDLLVEAHRTLGWFVLDLYQVGQYTPGFPDALGRHPVSGAVVLLEFKTARGRLTEDERRFHALWPGLIEIERSVEDVMRTHEKYGRLEAREDNDKRTGG